MQKCNFGLYEHHNYKSLFFKEHKQSITAKPHIHARDVDLIHTKEFISWFEERVDTFTIYSFILSNKHVYMFYNLTFESIGYTNAT